MSAACSDSEPAATSLAELGVDDGASQGLKVEKMVSAGAEASLELDTGAKLKVPQGSTQKALNIGLKRPSDEEALDMVKSMKDEYKLASAPYVLTPHGSNFEKDVEVTLPVAKDRDGDKLRVAWLSDEKDKSWELIGTPEVSAGKATIKVDHFSVFALVEYEAGDHPGVDLDSGVSPRSDGGVSPQEDGGDVQADSGAWTDAGADLSLQESFYKKFETCGILERPGDFSVDVDSDDDDLCELTCIANASCADFLMFGCGATEDYSDRLYECVSACYGGRPIIRSTPDFCGPGEDAEVCDGWEDCSDGSDENGCPAGTHFICTDGEKVPASDACDGGEDCWDGSDENNCPAGIHFQCTNGQRVPVAARCDGGWDCSDESDEANCPSDHYFFCTSGSRIPKEYSCDTYADCSDGSDEDNCEGKVFTCADGSDSLRIQRVCDATLDCADGSDEPSRCLKLSCDWLADSDDVDSQPVEPDAGVGTL